jgi:hypothetical protein
MEIKIPAIIAEATKNGCKNENQMIGFLASEVSRLRSGCLEMAEALATIRDNSHDEAASNSAALGLGVAEILGIEEDDLISANVVITDSYRQSDPRPTQDEQR